MIQAVHLQVGMEKSGTPTIHAKGQSTGTGSDSEGYLGYHSSNDGGTFFSSGVRGVNQYGDSFGFLGESNEAGVFGRANFSGDEGVRGEFSTGSNFGYLGGSSFGVFAGGGLGTSGSKSFVQPHPTDGRKEIVFVSLEGNENGTYFRGSGQVVGGQAEIEIPEEWTLVSAEDGITVHLTPKGPALLWTEEESRERIQVRGSADVAFNYLVLGLRRGFEEHVAIRPNVDIRPLYRGIPAFETFSDSYRRILVDNGILNPDFTPNEAFAKERGWLLSDVPPDEFRSERPIEMRHPGKR